MCLFGGNLFVTYRVTTITDYRNYRRYILQTIETIDDTYYRL